MPEIETTYKGECRGCRQMETAERTLVDDLCADCAEIVASIEKIRSSPDHIVSDLWVHGGYITATATRQDAGIGLLLILQANVDDWAPTGSAHDALSGGAKWLHTATGISGKAPSLGLAACRIARAEELMRAMRGLRD